jgi:hypothetical protein
MMKVPTMYALLMNRPACNDDDGAFNDEQFQDYLD